MAFYENYLKLCEKAGKTPSAAALEMGLSKPTVNRWKKGGGATDATALKVASYFGVTVEELTGEEQKEKPSATSEIDLSGLSPDDIELVKRLIDAPETKKKRNPSVALRFNFLEYRGLSDGMQGHS